MKANVAFLLTAPGAIEDRYETILETPEMDLYVVGVKNYDVAVQVAKELAEKGITAIELCAGFGNEGAALVAKAVRGKAIVGAVRFDLHPLLDHKSGDERFSV